MDTARLEPIMLLVTDNLLPQLGVCTPIEVLVPRSPKSDEARKELSITLEKRKQILESSSGEEDDCAEASDFNKQEFKKGVVPPWQMKW
jgi:hypothetical protein